MDEGGGNTHWGLADHSCCELYHEFRSRELDEEEAMKEKLWHITINPSLRLIRTKVCKQMFLP